MKPRILLALLGPMMIGCAIDSNAQANQRLSNLISPTAINQSLSPNSTNTKDLGSRDSSWRNIYFSSRLYLTQQIVLHLPFVGNSFLGINAGNISVTGSYNTGI